MITNKIKDCRLLQKVTVAKVGQVNKPKSTFSCIPPQKVTVAKVCQVNKPKSTVSCSSTINISKKPSPRCKVRKNNGGIKCHNRFQALQCYDVIDSNLHENNAVESSRVVYPMVVQAKRHEKVAMCQLLMPVMKYFCLMLMTV